MMSQIVLLSGFILFPIMLLIGVFVFCFLTSLPQTHSWWLGPYEEDKFVANWLVVSIASIAWYFVIPVSLLLCAVVYFGIYLGEKVGKYDLVKQEKSNEDS